MSCNQKTSWLKNQLSSDNSDGRRLLPEYDAVLVDKSWTHFFIPNTTDPRYDILNPVFDNKIEAIEYGLGIVQFEIYEGTFFGPIKHTRQVMTRKERDALYDKKAELFCIDVEL